ncbi:MAG: 3-methyl-2-oxobutanoate hydroxymethyltransferase [Burkholderiaceae bacterium]|nr:MAG: 3-methyl-2-oxobutanoate hydroxymethyltransferase [Burkholderiaceae bacterium]
MSSHTSLNAASGSAPRKPVSLHKLRELHEQGEKIVMLTAYDASMARLADLAGVDTLLVGDSLGMVVQGQDSTIPVTLEEMTYHTRCVARARPAAWIIGDLPFGSYQQGPQQALASSAALMAAGAQMVKLEGGGWTTETVRFLTERGIPVCAHLGLTPQSVHALGGYRIQGRTDEAVQVLRDHARALHQAGASMLVLELVPTSVAELIQADNPGLITIGIGAGPATAGQVLVLQDMLGITQGRLPRFVRNFMDGQDSILAALQAYVQAVKSGQFPDPALHTY